MPRIGAVGEIVFRNSAQSTGKAGAGTPRRWAGWTAAAAAQAARCRRRPPRGARSPPPAPRTPTRRTTPTPPAAPPPRGPPAPRPAARPRAVPTRPEAAQEAAAALKRVRRLKRRQAPPPAVRRSRLVVVVARLTRGAGAEKAPGAPGEGGGGARTAFLLVACPSPSLNNFRRWMISTFFSHTSSWNSSCGTPARHPLCAPPSQPPHPVHQDWRRFKPQMVCYRVIGNSCFYVCLSS